MGAIILVRPRRDGKAHAATVCSRMERLLVLIHNRLATSGSVMPNPNYPENLYSHHCYQRVA